MYRLLLLLITATFTFGCMGTVNALTDLDLDVQDLGDSHHGILAQGLALGRINFRFDRLFSGFSFGRLGRFDSRGGLLGQFAAQAADLFGPNGHRWQEG